jgi:hypothetical protein
MASDRQRQVQAWIDRRESRFNLSLREAQTAVRHKCFVSYHHDDDDEVVEFIDAFEDVFIPRVLGITDDDSDLISSTDTGYVMDEIRERYLTDSSVTIVLVGKCTWARRYVDWEVYSTLRSDKKNRRSGLLAITLPSAANYYDKKLPPRVDDNVDGTGGYARWYKYPTSSASLMELIDLAFGARTIKAHLVDNTRVRKLRNSSCTP